MVRKTKISKTFCKMLIIICIAAILYSLARSFLFSREGLDNHGLTDFVYDSSNATPPPPQSLPKVCTNRSDWDQATTASKCSWSVDVNDPNSCNTFQKGVCLKKCKGIWCNPKANPDPKCIPGKGWCQGDGM
jgi:hypothetical protein